jgi:hypothetical protein
MTYQHDIFVSYMHDAGMESWVHQHFIPFLRSFVGNALNRHINVFVDRSGIAAGDSWPVRLRSALAQSRCLVPIWSPLYFHSEWCRKELAVMLYREQQSGYRTILRPGGIVVPVNVFDGNFFPERAKQIQWLDLTKYWIVGDGFTKTERYVDFQDSLRDWANGVAAAIANAPAWQSDWLNEDWNNLPDVELSPRPSTNFHFVGLD